MSVQIIPIKYQIDTSDIEKADAILRSNARSAGLSEDGVADYNKEVKKTSQEYSKLSNEARRLEKILDDTTDPDEVKKYNRELRKTQRRLKELEEQGKKTDKNLRFDKAGGGKGFSRLRDGLGGISTRLSSLAAGAAKFAGPAAILTTAVGAIAKPAVESAARYEQLQVAFETFLGSTDAATEALERLNQFSLRTPFTPEQVQESGKALLAFGEPVEQLETTLGRIGDIASGTGKDFNELSIIYGKARVAGTLYAEDINQLVEAGVPIIDEFAKILGVTNSEVKQLASEGKIGFDDLETAFTNLTSEGGKFFGLIDAQSQTLSGRISTLQGRFAALSKGLGEGLAPTVGAIVDFLNGLLSRIDELDETVDGFTSSFDPLIEAFEGLLDVLGAAGNDIDFVGGVLKVLEFDIKLFGSVIEFAIIKPLTIAINILRRAIEIGTAAADTFRFLRDNISRLGDAIKNLSFSGITDFFNDVKNAFGQSLEETELEKSLARTLRNLESTIDGIDKDNFEKKGKEVLDAISRGLEGGVIDEARAQKLSKRLAARVAEVTKPVEKVEVETNIEITPKLPDAELKKLQKEKDRIKKEAEKLQAEVLKLSVQIEIESAGGNSTLEGLRLQEEDQIRQLESQEAFIELKKKNEELAQQGIDNIRNQFAAKRLKLIENQEKAAIKLQGDALSDSIDEINRTIAQKEIQISISQDSDLQKIQERYRAGQLSRQEFEGEIDRIAKEAQIGRDRLALQALEKANAARKQAIADLEKEIQQIESVSISKRTEKETARLAALNEQNQKFKDDTLKTENEIADARVALNEAVNEKLLEGDENVNQKRLASAQTLLEKTGEITNLIGDFVENQKQRELAAAEGNEKKQEEIQRRAAKREKAVAIAQALIGASLAVVRVLSNLTTLPEPIGTIQKVAAAASIAAAAFNAVNQIRAVGFAEGTREAKPASRRKVKGKRPGARKVDDIPAVMRGRFGERELIRIDEGERITAASINKKFFEDLNAIEDGRFKPGMIAKAANMDPVLFNQMVDAGKPIIKPIAVRQPGLAVIDSSIKQVERIDYKKLGKEVANSIEAKKWERGSSFWRELNNFEHRLPKMIAKEVANVLKNGQ